MKDTANINSPHVVLVVVIFGLLVIFAVVLGEILKDRINKHVAKKRMRRHDSSILQAAEEARRDFR